MAPVRRFCVITVLLVVVLAVLPPRAQNGASPKGLDKFVNQAIKDWPRFEAEARIFSVTSRRGRKHGRAQQNRDRLNYRD